MAIVLVILAIAGLVLLPGLWVRQTMARYAEPADRYRDRGTGAELARHLLARLDLAHVRVERTERGDHYDPAARAVRLSPTNYDGHSLTAITVAAHEVGHAVQHRNGERLFLTRGVLARLAMGAERFGGVLFLAAPLVSGLARSPAPGALFLLLALGSMLLGTLTHLVTLPVEFDASFGKALPMLEAGRYLKGNDAVHARRILKAAALTYVAGSLLSLLNVWRWARVLRR